MRIWCERVYRFIKAPVGVARKLATRNGRRRIAWLAAVAATRFMSPRRIFKLTGVLPFKQASTAEVIAEPFDPEPRSADPHRRDPISVQGEFTWSVFPFRSDSGSEFITLHGGIVNASGHVFDRYGRVVHRACHKKRHAPERGWVPRPWRPLRQIREVAGTVAGVTASTQWNYYHWLFDVLPRLAMLSDRSHPYDFIYLQSSRRFQRETLSLLNLDPSTILSCDEHQILSAERFLVPCHQSTGRTTYPLWVRDRLREWFLPPAGTRGPRRRLYIGRAREHGRHISNESELFAFLETLGFEYLLPEHLSFLDQVAAFRDAEVIVAAHGAGLANIAFCDAGTRLVELFPPETKYTYYKISQTLDMMYYLLRSPGHPRATMARADYPIPLKDLQRTLELLGLDTCSLVN